MANGVFLDTSELNTYHFSYAMIIQTCLWFSIIDGKDNEFFQFLKYAHTQNGLSLVTFVLIDGKCGGFSGCRGPPQTRQEY